MEIKNSSNKIIGELKITEDKIFIDNFSKPLLIIEDKELISQIINKNRSNEILLILYNEYYLTIGEIAALYGVCYSNINKQLKTIPSYKGNKQGRRNRAFGHPVTFEQSQKMSTKLKGRKNTFYERTPEIKEKISKSLKAYFKEHPQDPTPHRNNWTKGIYNNVDFKIGISGYFNSLKNNKKYFFRSLLELFFMLKLEEDSSIITYQYEPIHIKMDNGAIYTPDILLNDKLIELKSKKYVERVKEVKEKVEYKTQQALKYCKQNNLQYQIIYDEDIGFISKNFKRFLRDNPQIIKKYNIVFNDPSRMVIK